MPFQEVDKGCHDLDIKVFILRAPLFPLKECKFHLAREL